MQRGEGLRGGAVHDGAWAMSARRLWWALLIVPLVLAINAAILYGAVRLVRWAWGQP